jgi:hypothetical protein
MLTTKKEKKLLSELLQNMTLRLWFSGDENFMFWYSLLHIKHEMLITIYQTVCLVFQS